MSILIATCQKLASVSHNQISDSFLGLISKMQKKSNAEEVNILFPVQQEACIIKTNANMIPEFRYYYKNKMCFHSFDLRDINKEDSLKC